MKNIQVMPSGNVVMKFRKRKVVLGNIISGSFIPVSRVPSYESGQTWVNVNPPYSKYLKSIAELQVNVGQILLNN